MAAAALTREDGIYPVAQAWRLEKVGLKERVGINLASLCPGSSKPVFVEFIAPPTRTPEEYRTEIKSTRGDQMRAHRPATATPD